ncbi:MAG TPA: hypothetical protein V6C52_01025 [Coleofasciculaceae cyanobacterium]|jgi:hypothetical protein
MKKHMHLMTLLGLFCLLTSPALAADPGFPISAEHSGIQQILGIIKPISLAKTDQKTQESLTDMLIMKNQLHTMEAPDASAAQLSVQGKRIAPPRRHRHMH